jgi:putative sterol carrier protein
MMSLETATQLVTEKVAALSEDLGATVKFNLGEGVIFVNGNTISHEDLPADCTIHVELSDFMDMLHGNLSSMSAFTMGKMSIEGDMGVAMKLQGIFG